ncbi:MAG: hypothetical protein IT182_02210 [Acidobacteria bacterium]|nr:hypothetical protein [Acidobacteriota bacterium]
MTPAELRSMAERPDGLTDELVALWQEARGDWRGAHVTVQDLHSNDAAWVHAYLHRREGDDANARYWYARAGRPPSRLPLDDEWAAMVSVLLGD